MTEKTVLLNADLGEGGDSDAALMPLIDIANVACAAHAGDQETIRATIELAISHGVQISAHPSYPDPANFGRRSMTLDAKALRDTLFEQLDRIAVPLQTRAGKKLDLVKPHGALYNDCARNPGLAQTLVSLLAAYDSDLTLIAATGSSLQQAAAGAGIGFLAEGFADRRYLRSGLLAPRSEPGACIGSVEEALAQAMQLISGANLATIDGGSISLGVDTICVHGDNPNALALARAIAQLPGVASRAGN